MLRSSRLIAAVIFSLAAPLAAQSNPAPHALVEKAVSLQHGGKVLPRYTYFSLHRSQNRTPKGKLFFDETNLYEWTWIGEFPYTRVVEMNGKPLKGQALKVEQARYDKAVADHSGLNVDDRARARHYHVVNSNVDLEPLLTPAYQLTELRQDTLAGTPTHVIDCTPLPSADPARPVPTQHITLWITDSGIILRQTYELVADESDKLRGSHGEDDFQLIDGTPLPLHDSFHLNAPNGNTGDFETTYSRFRRFTSSATILPANDPKPPDSQSSKP